MAEAMKESCNTYFIELSKELDNLELINIVLPRDIINQSLRFFRLLQGKSCRMTMAWMKHNMS